MVGTKRSLTDRVVDLAYSFVDKRSAPGWCAEATKVLRRIFLFIVLYRPSNAHARRAAFKRRAARARNRKYWRSVTFWSH